MNFSGNLIQHTCFSIRNISYTIYIRQENIIGISFCFFIHIENYRTAENIYPCFGVICCVLLLVCIGEKQGIDFVMQYTTNVLVQAI